jgi:hypothetical protein
VHDRLYNEQVCQAVAVSTLLDAQGGFPLLYAAGAGTTNTGSASRSVSMQYLVSNSQHQRVLQRYELTLAPTTEI